MIVDDEPDARERLTRLLGKHEAFEVVAQASNGEEALSILADSKIDVIVGARYAEPSWSPDSRGFYYTWLPVDPAIPAADRPGRQTLRYHPVGADPKADPIVFPPLHDPQRFVAADVTADGSHLLLTIQSGWRANDLYFRKIEARPHAHKEARRARGSCQNDCIEPWIFNQLGTGRIIFAVDELQDIFRNASIPKGLRQFITSQHRLWSRFKEDAISACKCCKNATCRNRCRKIPRGRD